MSSNRSMFSNVRSRPTKPRAEKRKNGEINGGATSSSSNAQTEESYDIGGMDADEDQDFMEAVFDSDESLAKFEDETEKDDEAEERELEAVFSNTLLHIMEQRECEQFPHFGYGGLNDGIEAVGGMEGDDFEWGDDNYVDTTVTTDDRILPTMENDNHTQFRFWTSRWPICNFTQSIFDIANSANGMHAPVPVDGGDDPIDPGNPGGSTKTQFCQAIRSVGAHHNWTTAGLNALFGILADNTNLDLPVTVNPRLKTKQFHWKKFLPKNPGNFKIDCCVNFCCAFIAGNQHKIQCQCGAFRYSPCDYGGRGACSDGQYCSPFSKPSHNYRRAHMVMYYRSIIMKLLDLYKKSLTFDKHIFSYNSRRRHKPGFLYDMNDGAVVQQEIDIMHNAFLERAAVYSRENNGVTLHECSLALSVFYDGDTLFKRKSDSMWNMFVSVLNCDPSFRTKLGLGLFLAMMHNMPVGSGAEQDVIDHLYTGELKQLENGIVFEFMHEGSLHAVFLQARVVFLHLDTRALESFLHCQTAGSMAGCPFCYIGMGLSRAILGARIYVGTTCLSDPCHVLRTLGEVKPTPNGYFGDQGIDINRALGKELSDNAQKIQLRSKENNNNSDEDGEEGGKKKAQKKKKSGNVSYNHPRSVALPEGTVWENNDFPYEWFAPAIFLPHNDNRVETLERVTHEVYLNRHAKAKAEKDAYLADCARRNKQPAESRTFVYEGVHATTSEWMKLKSPRMDNMTNDPLHSLGGMVDYTIESIIGERANTDGGRKLALYQKRFVSWARDKRIKPPYKASNAAINMVDSVMYCISVPTQHKRAYYFTYPFHGKTHLIMHQKLAFMTTYMTYLVSFLDITKPYKCLHRRVSHDYQRMFNPILETRSLKQLKKT